MTTKLATPKNASQEFASDDFLQKLQAEVRFQKNLHQRRLLPKQLDFFTSLVGRYPWQTSLILAGLTALILEWG